MTSFAGSIASAIGCTPILNIKFLGGDGIEAACFEAVRIAKLTGCLVAFDFNGVHCMARSETNPLEMTKMFYEQFDKSPIAYKVAGP